ncbi:alpha/beta-hydrolase [Periconia macrospinosa]|uniref:1-alkyl-2-acetylglycerophosphocholine esterase n=1 Tax=Periconia macrospinosa TaxID=97972 RepID=A0A2V1D6P7_9PLEO|nr:alpha/beta-hydrolase [Periconia macrospinosa]
MLGLLPILPLLLANKAVGYNLPNPSGRYNVTLKTGPLIDHSRESWKLMVSVFQPANCNWTVTVPNMPNKSAEVLAAYSQEYAPQLANSTFEYGPLLRDARLPVCVGDATSISPLQDSPVLLFSHGIAGSRLYHNVFASALASQGFTVITMDHPGDATIIEYPDGQLLWNNDSLAAPLDELVYHRGNDTSFVLDQLRNATAMAELGLPTFPTDHIGILGHSLGGSTALQAIGQDSRILAASTWGGPVLTELPPSGIPRPILFVASEHESNWTINGMEVGWRQTHSPKLWTQIANLQHTGFLDAMAMLKAAGHDPAQAPEVLGTIDPDELNRILVAYTTEWMNGAFAGKIGGPLLEGEQPDKFPEVSVVKKENF